MMKRRRLSVAAIETREEYRLRRLLATLREEEARARHWVVAGHDDLVEGLRNTSANGSPFRAATEAGVCGPSPGSTVPAQGRGKIADLLEIASAAATLSAAVPSVAEAHLRD